MTFQVGQVVWVKLSHPRLRGLRSYTITKVGRKWVTLGDDIYRFDPNTLELDGKGYGSHGLIYLSEEQYNQETALRAAWDTLRTHVRDNMDAPAGVTTEHILQAIKLLGLNQ